MCIMQCIIYPPCKHIDWILDGSACEFGFNEQSNSCARGHNVYNQSRYTRPEGSLCADCLTKAIKSVPVLYMREYLALIKDSAPASMIVKNAMDAIEIAMKTNVERWKGLCSKKDVIMSGETRDWLRSKILKPELALLKMKVERATIEGKEDSVEISGMHEREERMYEKWKLADPKTMAMMFDGC